MESGWKMLEYCVFCKLRIGMDAWFARMIRPLELESNLESNPLGPLQKRKSFQAWRIVTLRGKSNSTFD